MTQDRPVFIGFLYRLRDLGVPVGTQEALALAQALMAGLHDSSLDGFYYAARAVLIHHEGHLDAFDRAFLAEFKGVDMPSPRLSEDLREWLDAAAAEMDERGFAETDRLEPIDIEALLQMFEERMREQTERHDGGNYWIGTRGSSPLGQAGTSQAGLSTGTSGGGRSAIRVADARNYRPYRSDVNLDIRQMQVALRRLRAFVREGADVELDIERTIDETARNAGEIEIVTRPPIRPNTHVILLIDVGGSMYPYSQLMSQLFSATKKSTHFKELRTYYFHNCVYGKVYETDRFTDPKWVHDLLRECGSHYKLIMVGDAFMAPYELLQSGRLSVDDDVSVSGLEWLSTLRDHFRQSVWLNPEPLSRWTGTTIQDVAEVFDMFPMTVDGLTEAMARLNRGKSARR
ncbi:MAG: VWA domain-containing protein [Candidatus Nanopelagicales bacterium]|nr:VWA domain-containing protein [Candidatus Nanopelagicales bacterium]MDZ4250047.1 VWA domain-containing protein [Candidatus Nanopelagicales bacterium]